MRHGLQQFGFTASRLTIDAILALRLLSKLHREFNQPLCVAYIDMKATSNSVDGCAFWEALRSAEAPPFCQSDRGSTKGLQHRVPGQLSQPSKTTFGVRPPGLRPSPSPRSYRYRLGLPSPGE
jgi:hypothetical protein